MTVDNLKAFTDTFNGQCAHRFFFTADAECACVETASGSLQLYEWFAPIEETAVFRWYEPGKVLYTGYAVVYILLLRIHIAESRNTVPFFRLVPARQPLGECFFSLSPEYAVDERVFMQKVFIVS